MGISGIIPLFSRRFGEASPGLAKPPLILLHGLLGSSRNWQTAGAELAQRFEVFALDLRNHGRSPHVAQMTYVAMMDDVLAWMDEQGLATASILGHSMGGKVAMLLACRQPTRVERLVVVDIAPKDYTTSTHRAEFAAMNELDLRSLSSRAEAELRFESRVPDWGLRKFLTTNLEQETEGGGWKWLVNLSGLTTALPELEANPLTEYDIFSGPAQFITGARSSYVRAEDWAVIQKHFPAAKQAVISNSGHNPHMETREAFVQAVLG